MARRPQFRDEDLLEAARSVFLARGARATTAEVAERAGVSEGTLFHHFKTKEALFRAVFNLKHEDPPELVNLAERVGKGAVAENLVGFATAMLEWLRARVPLVMLAWANAAPKERRELMCELDPLNVRTVKVLAGYLEAESRLGRVRRADAEIAARILMSGIVDYVRSEVVTGSGRELPLPAGMYVRELVDIFLHGISASAPAQSPRRRRTRH